MACRNLQVARERSWVAACLCAAARVNIEHEILLICNLGARTTASAARSDRCAAQPPVIRRIGVIIGHYFSYCITIAELGLSILLGLFPWSSLGILCYLYLLEVIHQDVLRDLQAILSTIVISRYTFFMWGIVALLSEAQRIRAINLLEHSPHCNKTYEASYEARNWQRYRNISLRAAFRVLRADAGLRSVIQSPCDTLKIGPVKMPLQTTYEPRNGDS
eukprot:6199626-Pleurochrysis_carterae.AAC.2